MRPTTASPTRGPRELVASSGHASPGRARAGPVQANADGGRPGPVQANADDRRPGPVQANADGGRPGPVQARSTRRRVGPARARVAALRVAVLALLVYGFAPLLAVADPLAADSAVAADFDRATWARLLERHTEPVPDMAGTRVDYAALTADPAWRRFVDDLARRAPPAGPVGRKAFWIDAYNALAIDMVVRHWPVDSIRDAGSLFRRVWSLDAGIVDGRTVTLSQIEHEILRPMGDPRIHMAIVCASTSCPSLARAPFDPEDLDARLDAAVGRFLGDPRKGLGIDRARGRIRLSRIFEWFDDDFEAGGGVVAFVREHLDDAPSIDPADRAWLLGCGPDVPIDHFDYDWSVNALRR